MYVSPCFADVSVHYTETYGLGFKNALVGVLSGLVGTGTFPDDLCV